MPTDEPDTVLQPPTFRDKPLELAGEDGPCIDVEGVHLSFGDKQVLQGVDLSIGHGETVAVMGESGGGKTVLLKVILGLVAPTKGRVRLFGQDITGLNDEDMIPIRKRSSVVFQDSALYNALTVEENIALELRELLELPEEEVAARVKEAIESVGLTDLQPDQSPRELSGGMRKRLAVARAVAPKPEVILYDEPTSGLDPPNSARILALIKGLHDRLAVTGVFVTHDIDGACEVASRVVFLADGVVAFDGTPEEFRASDDERIRSFRTSSPAKAAEESARDRDRASAAATTPSHRSG